MLDLSETAVIPVYRERNEAEFEIFRELTRKLNERGNLVVAQSKEIVSQSEAMCRHEARLALLLDCCPLGVIFICSRVIEYVNRRITDITGYTKEEIEGKNSRFLYETAEEWDVVGKVQCENKRSMDIDVRFKQKSGAMVPCKLKMTRVIDDCDREFIVLVYSDC